MESYKQHLDLANERFDWAERLFSEGSENTACHLFINAAINYHNALSQKLLGKIFSHKQHSDTSYFKELSRLLGHDYQRYKSAYEFLMQYKGQADYGGGLSAGSAANIRRQAQKIREITEPLL